jgi:DNA-binding winged helix-turn-helix (wHTH) protein/TolB-like protein
MAYERFRFGLFEFNATTRELRREGALVRLQAQPAQLLACLIARAGQTVSRDELRKALWGDDTFVDFDRGLNFCIAQIRSALRDDSTEPIYIRTIPKSGYQFIAPAERVAEHLPEENGTGAPKVSEGAQGRRRTVALASAAGILLALVFAVGYRVAGYRFRSSPNSVPAPIIAVLRFDNETGNPQVTGFSDGLTDTVVEQLTSLSNGRYQVIGNAQILRQPRDQRDLKAIASSLHAGYVVLGQIQLNNGQVRILAHLIRLPEQTHLWVVRSEGALTDPLRIESEVAGKIALEFSPRISADSSHNAASLPAANH